MSNILGTYLSNEELTKEFKELYLNSEDLSHLIDEDEIYNIIIKGKFTSNLNNAIYHLLSIYISKILPRYISCFGNAQINGIINIGVNDYGEITGIPTIDKINIDKIKYNIIDIITNNINSQIRPEELAKKISVDILPLQFDISILNNDAGDKFKHFSSKILAYNEKKDKYITKHQSWLIKHRRYAQKLNNMINIPTIRKELILYIQNSINPSNIVIELLEKDEYIHIDHDNIFKDRDNKDKVFYWLNLFRENKLKELQDENKKINETKPVLDKIQTPMQILCDLSGLRYIFIKKNPNIKYYYIKISLNMTDVKHSISFLQNNKWKSRTRIMSEDGPSCI